MGKTLHVRMRIKYKHYHNSEHDSSLCLVGIPTPRIKVLKDVAPIELYDGMTLQQNKQTWALSIPDIIRDDAGVYELIATNKTGSDRSSVNVKVTKASKRSSLTSPERFVIYKSNSEYGQ